MAYFKNSSSTTSGDLHAFVEFSDSDHGVIFAYVMTNFFQLMLSLNFLIFNMFYVFQLNRRLLDCWEDTFLVDSKHGKSTKRLSK